MDQVLWPQCALPSRPLRRDDVFFAVIADSGQPTRRHVAAQVCAAALRARAHATRQSRVACSGQVLQLQRARFKLFADPGSPDSEGVAELPVAGALESKVKAAHGDMRTFIGQAAAG